MTEKVSSKRDLKKKWNIDVFECIINRGIWQLTFVWSWSWWKLVEHCRCWQTITVPHSNVDRRSPRWTSLWMRHGSSHGDSPGNNLREARQSRFYWSRLSDPSSSKCKSFTCTSYLFITVCNTPPSENTVPLFIYWHKRSTLKLRWIIGQIWQISFSIS